MDKIDQMIVSYLSGIGQWSDKNYTPNKIVICFQVLKKGGGGGGGKGVY